MLKQIDSLETLQQEAELFMENLTPAQERATLVTLTGELGAGKTAFTKCVARILGVTEEITSPTFVLQKNYTLPENKKGFKQLIHIDAYRLKSGEELGPLSFAETLRDAGNLILLEWPEQVADALPTPDAALTFTHQGENSRALSYD